eukprot:COSAG01_NODE_23_length_37704_cov_30.005877_7_plen_65_part_00
MAAGAKVERGTSAAASVVVLMVACHAQLRFRNPHPAARVYTLRTTQPDLVRPAADDGRLRFTYI